jgi:hypothetical protein
LHVAQFELVQPAQLLPDDPDSPDELRPAKNAEKSRRPVPPQFGHAAPLPSPILHSFSNFLSHLSHLNS